METIPSKAFTISTEVGELLQVMYKPVNGGYTLEDVLSAIEKLEKTQAFSSNDGGSKHRYTFKGALFGVVNRGKVTLNDDLHILGTFDAGAMLDPNKLLGEKVTLKDGGQGIIKSIRVTQYGGLLLAICEY